jgi:xanthine dehydrogenase accessory factor
VYEIALSVAACLRAGTEVDVAWVVATAPELGVRDMTEALAITPGGGRVGAILGGALDDQLADLSYKGSAGRIVDLRVGELDAQLAGLPGAGGARCLLVPATQLPAELWDRLRRRDPVALLTRLDDDQVIDVTLVDPETTVAEGQVLTALAPVPKLVIAGAGPVAEALRAAAALLGWHIQTVTDASSARGVIAGLAALDSVVVLGHDDDLTGSALEAALAGTAGYIGSLGSRRMQQSRADWLAYRGVTDLDRVCGPAGLDIGATTPAEIAVSVLAEALAVKRSLNQPSRH